MAREVVTEMFKVVDSNGRHFAVREVTTYALSQIIGGGESIAGVVYKLENGNTLSAALGSVDFLDQATGDSYKRA